MSPYGGIRDIPETPAQTLLRELQEETGLTIGADIPDLWTEVCMCLVSMWGSCFLCCFSAVKLLCTLCLPGYSLLCPVVCFLELNRAVTSMRVPWKKGDMIRTQVLRPARGKFRIFRGHLGDFQMTDIFRHAPYWPYGIV
jgi:8-oxo-dGTP pyrophosphatase MutT (NUDIX family)